jgi:hypothetical protein
MIYIYSLELSENEKCKICYKKTLKNKFLIPCGDTQICDKCIDSLVGKKCPICDEIAIKVGCTK